MKFRLLTISSLIQLHASVKRCMAEDDGRPASADWTWGVREYRDWRVHSDALEAELKRRDIPFTSVVW
ncbi:hypothetical protein [Rhizobium lentis]|uniref:hypothetical protein n=1 Tax=Rhizobium lentis TaxID=1138194 RepID=UPI001C83B0D0|nr:hypothetical protein [Rhizobium lentis]MBX5063313.1 hypothetical protein [Rhizobium lentis]MBX5075418.1 hypothetical protein [Rhizobium lentis]